MDKPAQTERILVVMPAFNESGRIAPVIQGIRAVLPDADVAVINDASTDTTAEEASAVGAMVLPHAVNMGYGASLETAYLFAMRKGYAMVVQMDSDGQHLPEELPAIVAPLRAGEADIVLGSRYGGHAPSLRTPPIRRAGQLFFGGVLFLLTRRWFTDPTSGFQALSGRALRLFASGVFPCDYPDADVLLMAHLAGLRIREAPVRMAPRQGGVSIHSGWKPLYYGIKMLLSLFIVLLNAPVWREWRARLRAG